MRRIAVLLLVVVLGACGGEARRPVSEPPQSSTASPLSASPTFSPSPSPLDQTDYDSLASKIRRLTLTTLDRVKEEGKITLGIAQIQEHPSYGRTLVIHVSDTEAGALATSVFVLAALAEAVGAYEMSLPSVSYASISFLELSDESRLYIKMEDLYSFAHDEISLQQLRQRVIFP